MENTNKSSKSVNFQNTAQTLSGKMLTNPQADTKKLDGLQNQLGKMEDDFEDMRKAREEAKRQLDKKFEDSYG